MHLLLIRHGESVDNVAGLYAGSRDSPLTSHGVLQATRLGSHLAQHRDAIGPIRFIFTSNLQRAFHTAEAIAKAQQSSPGYEASDHGVALEVTRLPELREKDFGSSEGKKFRVKVGNNVDGIARSDSESREAMKIRADRFLELHLHPIIDKHVSENITVVIVAHGIILNVILMPLLARFPPTVYPSLQSRNRDGAPEFFVTWGNTGVLQARLGSDENRLVSNPSDNKTSLEASKEPQSDMHTASCSRRVLGLTIDFVNNLDHLQGLKKTKGGIGSAKYDSRQRTVDSFFKSASKKRKLEEAQE
ncbi:phosphoglycerate mutase-like protein [Xylariaceae sp. FL0662B]|nr:phosphoglycerate mutase-like protein [Xylariaceae sp. FL0662B]